MSSTDKSRSRRTTTYGIPLPRSPLLPEGVDEPPTAQGAAAKDRIDQSDEQGLEEHMGGTLRRRWKRSAEEPTLRPSNRATSEATEETVSQVVVRTVHEALL